MSREYQVGEQYINETTDYEYQLSEVYFNETAVAEPVLIYRNYILGGGVF